MANDFHNPFMNDELLLLQNGYIAVPESDRSVTSALHRAEIGTVLANIAYYGYVPSEAAFKAITKLDSGQLATFWAGLEKALGNHSGNDRNMNSYVVYKNFPSEVLSMDEGRYWFNQILMYWGLPVTLFAEETAPRPELADKADLKVLHLADGKTRSGILSRLVQMPASWNDSQKGQIGYFLSARPEYDIVVDTFGHKTNGVSLAAAFFADLVAGHRVASLTNATDVLRLAAAVSDGDVSLRKPSRFRKMTRAERRYLIRILEETRNIEEDFALRQEQWKRLLSRLHPGDFKAPKVSAAYAKLFNGELKTFDAALEVGFKDEDPLTLDCLKMRPGVFMRRLHQAYAAFGDEAFEAFMSVTDRLSVAQLLKLDGYLKTVNDTKEFIVRPRGNWARAQILPNDKKDIEAADLSALRGHLSREIGARLDADNPWGYEVDPRLLSVKLQSNGQDLASYGRGTVFDLPDEVTFLRTASYWKNKSYGSCWFDNGWNFFSEDWKPVDTISWDNPRPFGANGAVFSGDPVNANEIEGRACQIIDLYPEQLLERGVRYAVWNVLCFSHIKFGEAEEVLAVLQWGEDANAGELVEPSRAQMVFPLKGDDLTKYVAYVDLVERKLVYMDVGLPGTVSSAKGNEEKVSAMMPAFVEHVATLPSVADLFSHATVGNVPVLFTDDRGPVDGVGYVFKSTNAKSRIEPLDFEMLLSLTGEQDPKALAA